MRSGRSRGLLALAVVSAVATVTSAQVVVQDKGRDLVPNGKGWGEPRSQMPRQGQPDDEVGQARPGKRGTRIKYHLGPLILGTTSVYYIWYGNWPTGAGSARDILTDFASSIGGTPYYNINTTYYNASNQHVSNAVHYGGSTDVNYSFGSSLSDANLESIVSSAIVGGALPRDTHAVYFVLTSSDVNEASGFCTQYCSWHDHATIGGSNIKYSFVGDPTRCPSSCEVQATGPNGSSGADGMASLIAHELDEAVTDPLFTGWYDQQGLENADKCAWAFGTTTTAPNGALTNMAFGGRDWLIQRKWANSGSGYCASSF
jgi:phosphate-induced protein 1